MKTYYSFLLTVLLAGFTLPGYAQVKIGDHSAVLYPGSLLELESTSKGLRLSHVALSNTTTWAPLAGSGSDTAAEGMTVYNTNAGITNTSGNPAYPALGKGEYYWDGSGWVSKNAAGSLSSAADFIQAEIASDYSFVPVSGYSLPFTTNPEVSAGGKISINSNNITLQPGYTYRLVFNIGNTSSVTSSAFSYRFYNVTSVAYAGTSAFVQSGNYGMGSGITCEVILKPAVVTTLQVRVNSPGGTATTVANIVRSNITVHTL